MHVCTHELGGICLLHLDVYLIDSCLYVASDKQEYKPDYCSSTVAALAVSHKVRSLRDVMSSSQKLLIQLNI